MLPGTFAFVDIETTGGNPVRDRITEVAIIRIEDGEVVERWEQLINPGTWIPDAIQRLTGISNDMVDDKPYFDEIANDIAARLDGAVFVAHNARFDHGFLRNALKACDITLRGPVLCTVKLSRRLYPQHKRHNLDVLIERHQLPCAARHRAMGDAEATLQFVLTARSEIPPDVFDGYVRELTRRAALPAHLSAQDIDKIPDTPGVYLFYDERDTPLYIGKSINLRTRVMSHFSADHSSHREMQMAQQTARIDWIDTGGELGALLKESRLVKDLAPVYNRKLRSHRTLVTIAWSGDPGEVPELVGPERIETGRFDGLYGLFRSRTQGRKALLTLADNNRLCLRLVGLEKSGKGACFRSQIGKCGGACCGKESVLQHAVRLSEALAKLKLQSWQWDGAIGVYETHPQGWREMHVINNWCYLGSVRDESDLYDAELLDQRPAFDMDTYKLLVRHLYRSATLAIVPLKSD